MIPVKSGLRMTAHQTRDKPSVLFLCTHNSARSQMAEGLLRHFRGDEYEAYSAGTEKTRVHPSALEAMSEIGIDLSAHWSKHLDEYKGRVFDVVVTVCDSAKESCPWYPGETTRVVHRSFPDPSAAAGNREKQLDHFRSVRDDIRDWIRTSFPDP